MIKNTSKNIGKFSVEKKLNVLQHIAIIRTNYKKNNSFSLK